MGGSNRAVGDKGDRTVLVGTPAYGAILNRLGFGERPPMTTMDIDVSVSSFALSLPDDIDIPAAFQQWKKRMLCVPHLYHRDPATSLDMGTMNFSVDFLTPGPLMSQGRPREIKSLAFAAAQMPFLDYLTREVLPTLILTPTGLIAYVPEAGRFLIHKLALAAGRLQAWATKQRKDIHQALALYTVLCATDPPSIDHTPRQRFRKPGKLGRLSRGSGAGSRSLAIKPRRMQAWRLLVIRLRVRRGCNHPNDATNHGCGYEWNLCTACRV